jgi:hypothetical protein
MAAIKPGVQNMVVCANARWGKFFKFGGSFWKIIDFEIFLNVISGAIFFL